MDIVCPSCEAAYEIDESGVTETGRKVRCANCSTIWRVYPALAKVPSPENLATPVSLGIVEPGANPYATEPAEDIYGEGSPLLRKAIEDRAARDNPAVQEQDAAATEETIAALDEAIASQELATGDLNPDGLANAMIAGGTIGEADASSEEPRRARLIRDNKKAASANKKSGSALGAILSWKTASIAASLAVIGFGLLQREAVVRQVPQTAAIYQALGMPVNVRGIAIRNVASRLIDDNGVSILVIDGDLQNLTNRKIDLPRLRFAVKSPDGQEVYVWSAQADKNNLEAGESLNFRRRLAAPPSDGKDISVRFLTRADTTAGIK